MYSLPKNVYRERKDFSKIRTTVEIPNLIEIQRKSYERFLQMNRLPSEREDQGLQSVFKSVFRPTGGRTGGCRPTKSRPWRRLRRTSS